MTNDRKKKWMKRIAIGVAWLAVGTVVGLAVVGGQSANATYDHPSCENPTIVVPGSWWNWSPNHDQGPFDGPPAFPTDARGTWQGPHDVGGPQQDQTGTFQVGNGNSDWFHREPATEIPNPEYPCDPPDTTVPDTTVPDTTIPPPTTEPPGPPPCYDPYTPGVEGCPPDTTVPDDTDDDGDPPLVVHDVDVTGPVAGSPRSTG